MAHSSGRHRQC